MENKESILNPEIKDEELDVVSGGVMLPGQPATPPPDRPDPILDDPNSVHKPGQPDKDPKFF